MGNMLQIRYNVMSVSNVNAFVNIRGGVNNGYKDVYFVRAIGKDENFSKDIEVMDETLLRKMNEGDSFYYRINMLPKMPVADDLAFYVQSYSDWVSSGRTELYTKTARENVKLVNVLAKAFSKVEELYILKNSHHSDSMVKNFIVKLLFWYDELFKKDNIGGIKFIWDEQKSMKIVASNVEKLQEYLFYYMLTLTGCDVMLLQTCKDIGADGESLELSAKIVLGDFVEFSIPEYRWHETRVQVSAQAPAMVTGMTSTQFTPLQVCLELLYHQEIGHHQLMLQQMHQM